MDLTSIMYIISCIIIFLFVVFFDKIAAKYRKNRFKSVRKGLNAGDEYVESIDGLIKSVGK